MPYHGMFMLIYVTGLLNLVNCLNCVFMPPPLGARGIMFSGCPYIPPSVRPPIHPSVAWNALFSPVHGYIGPSDQPLLFYSMSVRRSVWRGFRAFAVERMEGMAWIFTYWCILTTFRTNYIMVMVCWFSFVWCHFDLVKRVKFGVSGHFPENAWREWHAILHADVSRPPTEMICLWSGSVNCSNFGIILT